MLRSRTLQSRLIGIVAATAAILVAGGALSTSAYAGEDRGSELPAHVFSPYFQAYTADSPAALSKASGAKYLTMAFLQTAQTGSCDILWNGDPTTPVAHSTFGADIAKIRARGGDVVPSFGGFSADDTATEIADSCTDVDKIAAAYEKVITTYDVTRLDMDIEDNSLTNTAGIDRRSKAVAKVEVWAQRHDRTLQIVYTLPTAPDGLEQTGVDVLASAVANHARVDIANIMTFDYYDDQAHEMATDTMSAAAGVIKTLQTLYPNKSTDKLWQMVGVTEMIGIDDYGSGGETGPLEIFTLADARTVVAWADNHNIAELSFWALGRDNGACPGVPGSDNCSGVAQSTWQYTHIMLPFTHGNH
jgi:chitinase